MGSERLSYWNLFCQAWLFLPSCPGLWTPLCSSQPRVLPTSVLLRICLGVYQSSLCSQHAQMAPTLCPYRNHWHHPHGAWGICLSPSSPASKTEWASSRAGSGSCWNDDWRWLSTKCAPGTVLTTTAAPKGGTYPQFWDEEAEVQRRAGWRMAGWMRMCINEAVKPAGLGLVTGSPVWTVCDRWSFQASSQWTWSLYSMNMVPSRNPQVQGRPEKPRSLWEGLGGTGLC